jgi:uncharacterized phage protein gp47/JayE
MNETWIEKDEKTIRADIIAIAKQETGLTSFKSVGVLRGFIEVIAKVVLFIYVTAINPIYRNASLDGATGFFLSLWGLMLGVARKQENKAEGRFTATAYGSGKVPEGSWIVVDGTELRYRVKDAVSFEAGTFTVPVIAEFPGSGYNIGPGTVIRLTRVVAGFDAVSVSDEWITAVGQDVETDEPYRERIKDRWRDLKMGDTKETYRYYAEEVNGVRSAQIIRTPRGPGSTDVIIQAVNGLPGSELLSAVEQALHDHELMAFDVQVKAPQVAAMTVEIEYSGEASEGEVMLVAENYIYSLGVGGRFKKNDLYDLYKSLALKTIEIISPARDVQADSSSIITATVTATKAAT